MTSLFHMIVANLWTSQVHLILKYELCNKYIYDFQIRHAPQALTPSANVISKNCDTYIMLFVCSPAPSPIHCFVQII